MNFSKKSLIHQQITRQKIIWSFAYCLFTAFFWLSEIYFPGLVDDGLDSSWQAVLGHAFYNNREFGKDIIFSFGPLGWAEQYVLPPGPTAFKFFWELGANMFYVATLLAVAHSLLPAFRIWFLVGSMFFCGFFPDTTFSLVLLLLVAVILLSPSSATSGVILGVVALAIMAQAKFTNTILAFVGVSLSALLAGLSCQWRRSALITVSFLSAYLCTWIILGQPLHGLSSYMLGSLSIAAGYPWAMVLRPDALTVLLGMIVAFLHVAFGIRVLLTSAQSLSVWALMLFMAAVGVLTWKHAFTRADAHVLAWFSLSPVVAVFLASKIPTDRGWSVFYPVAVWVFSLSAIALFDNRLIIERPSQILQKATQNLFQLRNWRTYNAGLKPAEDPTSVELRAALNGVTVDVFSFEQGAALRAGLDYRGRPVPQSYSAYTSFLIEANAEFYRSTNAPVAVLFKLQSIDGRPPTMDDSLAIWELCHRYRYDRMLCGYALLRRDPARSTCPPPSPKHHAWVLLPWGKNCALLPKNRVWQSWLCVDLQPTWWGRLRAAFFQPSIVKLIVTDCYKQEHSFRLVPAPARIGFMVHPWLKNTEDFTSFVSGAPTGWITAFRLETNERKAWKIPKIQVIDGTETP